MTGRARPGDRNLAHAWPDTPVVLTTFNGGYPGMAMDPHARVGFSAHGSLRRSEFGMGYGVPAPGTTMGVGDQVDFQIETELTGPAFQQP